MTAPAVGLLASLWLSQRLAGVAFPDDIAATAAVVISASIAGFVMVLKATDLESSSAARGIATLPLSDRARALSIYLPLVALFGLMCLATVAPLIVLVGTVEGSDPAGVVLAVVLLNVHAFFWGLVLVGLARLAVKRSRMATGAVYPLAVVFWVGWVAAGVTRTSSAATGDDAQGLGILVDVVLGGPAIFPLSGIVSGSAILVALGAVGIATLGAFRLTIGPTGSRAGLFDDTRRSVSVTWAARRRRGALLRLHLLRLLRNNRVVGSVGASIGLMIIACWYLSRTSEPTVELGRSMLFPLSIAACHVCLVARGLSPRHRPYPLIAGLAPQRWALSIVLASLVLALTPWLAFVGALSIILDDAPTALIGLGLGIFVIGVALVLGALIVPGRENAGGEIAGLLVVSVAAMSCVQVLAGVGVTGDTEIALILGLTGLGLLGVPLLVERARWRGDVGAPA